MLLPAIFLPLTVYVHLYSVLHSELRAILGYVVRYGRSTSSKLAPIESPYAISYCIFFLTGGQFACVRANFWTATPYCVNHTYAGN